MVASAVDSPGARADIDRDIQFQAPPAEMGHYLGARYRMTPYDKAAELMEGVLAVDMVGYTNKAVGRCREPCGA